jgi:hypothetical protein
MDDGTADEDSEDKVARLADDASSPQNKVKLAELRDALDAGLAELDAGLGVGCVVDELLAQVRSEAGLEP